MWRNQLTDATRARLGLGVQQFKATVRYTVWHRDVGGRGGVDVPMEADVILRVDLDAAIQGLGAQAARNKGRKSKEMDGVLLAEAFNVRAVREA